MSLPLPWQRTFVSMHAPNTSIPAAITFMSASMTPIFISPTSTPLTTSPTSVQNLSLCLLFSDCTHSLDFATSLRIFHSRRSYYTCLFLILFILSLHELHLHHLYSTTLYPYYFTGPQVEEEF